MSRSRVQQAARIAVHSLLWVIGAALVGLAVNHLRGGFPLVAPFPYQFDCPDKVRADARRVTAEVALQARRRRPGEVLLVDARPAVLFGRGHVPGARSIPYSFVTPLTAAGAKALNAYRAIFVYCDSPGDRLASLLAAQMRERGLRQASVVSGGWAALRRLLPSATAPGSQPASRAADEDEEETMEDLLR